MSLVHAVTVLHFLIFLAFLYCCGGWNKQHSAILNFIVPVNNNNIYNCIACIKVSELYCLIIGLFTLNATSSFPCDVEF